MYVVFSQCKVSTSTDTISVSGDVVFVGHACGNGIPRGLRNICPPFGLF